MAKKEEKKIVLERAYIIPLRRECKKVARYRKAEKAMKCIREFIARHMQVREDAGKKIKISKFINQAVWFRGIKKPPAKIKIKAVKFSTGIVEVELAELPKRAQIAKIKEEKEKEETSKREEEREKARAAEEAQKSKEQLEEEKRAEELKKEERLLEKEHKEIRKENFEAERELIKPKVQVQQRKALEK